MSATNSRFSPEDRAAHAMKQVVWMIGINMGFTERGNDKEYLDLIRAELSIDLRVLEIRLVEFYTKYPFADAEERAASAEAQRDALLELAESMDSALDLEGIGGEDHDRLQNLKTNIVLKDAIAREHPATRAADERADDTGG